MKSASSLARRRTSSSSKTPSRRRRKKRGMPPSSTLPRGERSAEPGRDHAPERQQVVLVAAGAVQQQDRSTTHVRGDEPMEVGEFGGDGHGRPSRRASRLGGNVPGQGGPAKRRPEMARQGLECDGGSLALAHDRSCEEAGRRAARRPPASLSVRPAGSTQRTRRRVREWEQGCDRRHYRLPRSAEDQTMSKVISALICSGLLGDSRARRLLRCSGHLDEALHHR